MLRIYEVALEMVRDVRPMVDGIRKHDVDLARQLRRAAASVVLNIAEGAGSRGGNARARFESATGSAREVSACLRTAEALGYVHTLDAAKLDRIERIAATAIKLSR